MINFEKAGWFGFPRLPFGAKNGESVSINIFESGILANISRSSGFFVKVEIPFTPINKSRFKALLKLSFESVKECKTPQILPNFEISSKIGQKSSKAFRT